jgi:trehalose synthase
MGLEVGWRIIQGASDFFGITKKMHNALQGDEINLTEMKKEIYEKVLYENSMRNHLDHDFVVIHDPQPLGLIKHYKRNGPWIWRCHIDLTKPNRPLWDYLKTYVQKYDAMIVSIKEYRKRINVPQFFFMPAIDPFTIKNRELTEQEIDERLSHYDIPTDLPLVVQVSRFDRWKDPVGVIKAFKMAQKEVKARLVLLGNLATDDPEGIEVYKSLLQHKNDSIKIISVDDTALVNALQRRATVILQKSLREGFGLTVTEAMWKGTPVIGGNVGGIRYQIQNGINGFLVSSIKEASQRIIQLIQNEDLRLQIGNNGKKTVREKFLLTRLVEQYLDLFGSFQTVYTIKN